MHGVLELTVESRGGRSVLSHRRASPPFFVSKPYERDGALEVQIQQVGPGLLGGDQAEIRVEVEDGAHLILTTPSATRLLPRGDRTSVLRQDIVVRKGACLEYWPEPLYPHRGAALRQETHLVVEKNASLFWFDALAPGRDASGERYLWENLDLQTNLWEEDRLILRERLQVGGAEWAGLAQAFPKTRRWSGIFCVYTAPKSAHQIRAELASRESEGSIFGLSEPHPGLLVLKFMADDGQSVRVLKNALKSVLHTLSANGTLTPCQRIIEL